MTRRWKSVLLGCGGGCLGLLVLGIAGCVTFVVWLNRPGELLEPERLIGRDAVGYVEWNLRLEDPGTEQFVGRLIRATQQTPDVRGDGIPPWLLEILIRRQNRRNEAQIRQMFPMVAAWTLYNEGGRDTHVGTISLAKVGNRLAIADWMLGWTLGWSPEAHTIKHHGERIYLFGQDTEDSTSVFIRGNDIFVTSSVDSARQAVDLLLLERTAAREATELERVVAALPTERALRGSILNDDGELTRLWRELAGDGDLQWDEARALTLVGGFVDDNDMEGTLGLRFRSAAEARELGGPLVDALRSRFESRWLKLAPQPEIADDWARIDFRIEDVTGYFAELTGWDLRRALRTVPAS